MSAGDLIVVKTDTALWKVNPNDTSNFMPAREIQHWLPSNCVVLHLGDESDYYVKVLSNTGKVGWIHKSNVVNGEIPPTTLIILKMLFKSAQKKFLVALGFTIFAIVMGTKNFE